jgi:hypothetical protein
MLTQKYPLGTNLGDQKDVVEELKKAQIKPEVVYLSEGGSTKKLNRFTVQSTQKEGALSPKSYEIEQLYNPGHQGEEYRSIKKPQNRGISLSYISESENENSSQTV